MSIKTIYTVDDYPLAAYIVKRTVEKVSKHHCTVLDFDNPLILLEKFKQNFKNIDMVITDYEMPKLRGDNLIKQLRIIKPDIKIVVVSAWLDSWKENNQDSLGKEVKALSPDLILPKPFPENWVELVDKVLESELCIDS